MEPSTASQPQTSRSRLVLRCPSESCEPADPRYRLKFMGDSSSRFVVYPAGAHAAVVAEAITASGGEVLGFVDDAPTLMGTELIGQPIRSYAWLVQQCGAGDVRCALGLGDNFVRERIASRLSKDGIAVATVVHPTAVVSPSATIGAGTVIFATAVINANARVGFGVIVNTGAIVEHNVEVGDFAHISPGAVLAGGSRLGAHSHLGAGAIVIDDMFVGARSIVGAGAVVTRAIPDDVVAFGVPAKVSRPNQRIRQ
jgi:sugar O-acyltransferase (sialic acid O-acetyltransferase NeuD family)